MTGTYDYTNWGAYDHNGNPYPKIDTSLELATLFPGLRVNLVPSITCGGYDNWGCNVWVNKPYGNEPTIHVTDYNGMLVGAYSFAEIAVMLQTGLIPGVTCINQGDGTSILRLDSTGLVLTINSFPCPASLIITEVVGALRADGTTYDVQWYQSMAGNVKILDNGVIKNQRSYPMGQNTNAIIGLSVGTHSICVEAA